MGPAGRNELADERTNHLRHREKRTSWEIFELKLFIRLLNQTLGMATFCIVPNSALKKEGLRSLQEADVKHVIEPSEPWGSPHSLLQLLPAEIGSRLDMNFFQIFPGGQNSFSDKQSIGGARLATWPTAITKLGSIENLVRPFHLGRIVLSHKHKDD
jgi:hypothetical protein